MRNWACFATGLLFGLCLAIGFSGRADYVIGSGVAIHLDGAKHCNWFTKGVGIEHSFSENWSLAAGIYDNSNCNTSAYLAGAWLPIKYGHFRLGTIAGLVTGYRAPLLPAAGSVVAYETKNWKVNAIFIPPAGDASNGVIWLQLGVPF